MNSLPTPVYLPRVSFRFPPDFEVSWAGAFFDPKDPSVAFCFGSVDGRLRFADQGMNVSNLELPLSPLREAINSVATMGDWAAFSTRADIGFLPSHRLSGGGRPGGYLPEGAHRIISSVGGDYFIAAGGEKGILTASPPFGAGVEVTSHGTDQHHYVYRVASLRSQEGDDVVVCAARGDGALYGVFSATDDTHTLTTATFKGLDIIDVCSLSPHSLAVAALDRSGTLVLFQDILKDRKPKKITFKTLKGVAYRILCHLGDIYVLTSEGLFVFAGLGKECIDGKIRKNTQIFPTKMHALDMTLAHGRWLLMIEDNEVHRYDADEIHASVPDVKAVELRDVDEPQEETEFADFEATSELVTAC